jgi:hypothetical protein
LESKMKRKNLFGFLCIFLLLVITSGCTERNGDIPSQFLSVQDLLEDRILSMNYSGGAFHSKVDYISFHVGDIVKIRDVISDISVRKNITSITFEVNYTYPQTNVTLNTLVFQFDGDLTDMYIIGDAVEITLTIDHTTYTNETKGMSTDIEVFKEGWNQTYFENLFNSFFITNFFYQIFPQSAISKVV